MLLKSLGTGSMAWLLLSAPLMAAPPTADARLAEAVKNRDKVSVQSLLKQKVDLNAPETDGSTALHWAARWDDLETAQALIGGGASVKVANRNGVTPLSLAAINGNAAMIELLLKAGADPNTGVPNGEPVLMTAARTGKADAVVALIGHGANVNVQESVTGQTALMWAAAEGNTAAVEALIARGAKLDARSKGGFTAFLFAVREGQADVVRAMLKAGNDVNETIHGGQAEGASALLLATANAHFELAAALLDAGADPNAAGRGWTPLHEITWVRIPGNGTNDPAPEGSGNLDSLALVKKLVEHGANLNARMTKAWRGGTTVLNMSGATPFLMAARTADAELMRYLAKLGADPLLPNADNTTPLMVAAGVGTKSPGEDPGADAEVLEAVKAAVELGGDVNGVDKNGETAMHGAAYKQVPSVVQYLVDHGAKIEIWNQKNKIGWTPLRIAEGVHRGTNLRFSPVTAAAFRKVMSSAGVSTEVEPEDVIHVACSGSGDESEQNCPVGFRLVP